MKQLYAPWRSEYTSKTARTKHDQTAKEKCVFCTKLAENKDTLNLILKRTKHHAILLNLYPYNAGHLLIIPLKHVASLDDISKTSRAELMELLNQSSHAVKKILKAEGINIGINLGKAAGAGIPSHLHFHLVPRWVGDTNFMPITAQTKQVSFDLKAIYTKLKKAFR